MLGADQDSPLFYCPGARDWRQPNTIFTMSKLTAFAGYLEDTVSEGTVSLLQLKSDVNDVFLTHVLLHDDHSEWSQEYRERIHILWVSIQAVIDQIALVQLATEE